MIVATVNTKGGVTKTTTTIYLANEYRLRNPDARIVIADLDKQGSASEWADLATDNGQPLPFEVQVSNVKRLPRLAADLNPGDALFIDAPPSDSSLIQAAIDVANFVIIPSRPAGMDTARVWETLRALEDDQLYAVLIVFARLGTNLLRDTKTAFDSENISRFDTLVTLKEKYPRSTAFGQPPTPPTQTFSPR
ncbi:hypothetical protein GCM10020255_008060 [Rhodococcus baikonurensis]